MQQLVIPSRPPAPVIEIEGIQRALALATDPAEIKQINAQADAFEQYMHDCGLYSIEDMRPINELRMAARWKLGRALAQVERGAGPGRGKKVSGDQTSFRDLLRSIDLDKNVAMEAQRIGCLPDKEMPRIFDEARSEGRLLYYSELVKAARPWWYQESRIDKHNVIREGAKRDSRSARDVRGPIARWAQSLARRRGGGRHDHRREHPPVRSGKRRRPARLGHQQKPQAAASQ